MDLSGRYTNRDFMYDETNKKVALTFNVEMIEGEPDDSFLLALATSAIIDILKDNVVDPEAFIKKVYDTRVTQ